MTDPIVKESLLALCGVLRDITALVERMNVRLYKLEDLVILRPLGLKAHKAKRRRRV